MVFFIPLLDSPAGPNGLARSKAQGSIIQCVELPGCFDPSNWTRSRRFLQQTSKNCIISSWSHSEPGCFEDHPVVALAFLSSSDVQQTTAPLISPITDLSTLGVFLPLIFAWLHVCDHVCVCYRRYRKVPDSAAAFKHMCLEYSVWSGYFIFISPSGGGGNFPK